MVQDWARERRWIVLGTDGRYVILGRHSDPTDEEVLAAERFLLSKGLSGWLAVMEGDYFAQRGQPGLLMVRTLAEPTSAFADAAAAFEAERIRAVQLV